MGTASRRPTAGGRARLPALLAAIAVGAVALLALYSPARGDELICSAFGGGPPYPFETYEATRDRQPYLLAQQLAAQNLLLPHDPAFALPEVLVGTPSQREPDEAALIAPQLLHAIGWIESGLNQAAIQVPYESVGDVLLSSSCAYGLMQVASFFSNQGDVPSRSETLAGTHYAYNVAAGARILVEKWNADFFPAVGRSDPRFVESWYYAIWAYNGWALANHPVGPEVDPFRRLPYGCEGPYNGYAYQELVLGCVVNPPTLDGNRLWTPLPVRLPDLAKLGTIAGPLSTEAFFDGWATVLSAPFADEEVARPFSAMDMILPPTAAIVAARMLDPATAAAIQAEILGPPLLTLDTTTFELKVTDDAVEAGALTIGNAGRGILVYRLVPQQDWLQVSRPAGVAIGSDVPLKSDTSRSATVLVLPNAEGLAEGLHQGTIMVEVLLPDGSVQTETVAVLVDKQGVPRYEAGTPRS